MIDKVQKIRKEVERIQLYTQWEGLKQVLDYIDKVQEEPVSSIWHDASEPPIIDKTFLLVAPNGNSSLCLWGGKELHSVTIGGGHSVLCRGDIYSYIDDLLNLDNSCNFGKNLQEEPIGDIEAYQSRWGKSNGYLAEPVSEDLPHIRHRDTLDEFAYQCSYDLSNDWAKETPTWHDVEMACKLGANWQEANLWKPADGDDLPEIDREVIALLDNGKVVFAHRPTPEGYDGKSITTGEAEHYTPKTYGEGGWNVPNIAYWLDCLIPKEIEL